jgi:hypothetical protein
MEKNFREQMEDWISIDYFDRYITYYEHPLIRSQIIAITQKRELAFLVSGNDKGYLPKNVFNQRNNRIDGTRGYDFWLWDKIGLKKNKVLVNFYISVPIYEEGLPRFPWDETRREKKDAWVKAASGHIESYDFLIDIDAKDHSDVPFAFEDAKKCLIKMIEKGWKNITVTFSGMGFHLLVSMKMVTENRNFIPHTPDCIYDEYKALARHFYDECSHKVDLGIYDHMRLMKVPYSIAHYKDCAYIAHAFNDLDEFLSFDLQYFNINNYHSYPKNVFNKLKSGLGVPITIQWQDENQRVQLLKRLRIE